MEVPCPECGSHLRLNAKLAGMSISCPECGAPVEVPEAAPARPARRARSEPPPAPPPKLKLPDRFTFWLMGAQAMLAVLGLSCLLGAFFREGWHPPGTSYFRDDQVILVLAGIGLILAGWIAHYKPILTTLATALLVLGACAYHYSTDRVVDASRTVALSAAMLALWLALQHRRAVR